MSIVEEYLKKSVEELNKILNKMKDDLEELEEERMFVLGQTGLHVSGGTVKKYEAEIKSLYTKIEACETALKQKVS